jgi:imidazolonepropionase
MPLLADLIVENGLLRNASIASYEGRIVFVGPAADGARLVALAPEGVRIDAAGRSVVPGFVDAHTHAVYAGDRRSELRRRLAGATYARIAEQGGGILSTVDATREAAEDDLISTALVRLEQMQRCGTTTAEVKSGYGLTLESELKMLRAIARLDAASPLDLVPTFLGAHEVPREHRHEPGAYVRQVVELMIPAVAASRLAASCDVFCERGAFTVDQSRTILEAAARAGFMTRVHADELTAGGGAELAAEVGARSADHLVFVSEPGARALAAAGTVATLLPSASLQLKLGQYAPARMLIGEGVPVALGTDLNPGGGLTPSMPFVITLACFAMALTLEEALVAATINAAFAIDRHEVAGSLEPGKQMDAVVVDGRLEALLATDTPRVHTVLKRGRIIAAGANAHAS